MKFLLSREEAHLNEIREETANMLEVTEEDKLEVLPSGRQRVYQNRAGWAVTYLKKAGLVENSRRGWYRITQLGKQFFKDNPDFQLTDLYQFESFQEFQTVRKRDEDQSGDELPVAAHVSSPQDQLEQAFRLIQKDLQEDLLAKLKENTPAFFERAVLDVLSALGYGGGDLTRTEVTRLSGDEGIDGIIREDTLGLEMIYIQAKRWQGAVGRPEIQKFVGALAGQSARKGIVITTGSFSKEALDYAAKIDQKVVLIDGDQLTRYMIERNVGVSTVYSYHIKRIDSDYFEE